MTDDQLKFIRILLEVLLVVSGSAVWWGVYLEQSKFLQETQDRGWLLLVRGLAAETAIGFFLFVVDTRLSDRAADALLKQKQLTESALNEAASANTSAAAANNKAASLLAENVELEHALAPRDIEQGGFMHAIAAMPRVPIVLDALNKEEPKYVSDGLYSGLTGIKIGDTPSWAVSQIRTEYYKPDGITIQYVDAPGGAKGASERVAVALCEAIKDQGYQVSTRWVPPGATRIAWPQQVPTTAVLIEIGSKPNKFWENKMLLRKGMRVDPEPSICTSQEGFEAHERRIGRKWPWPGDRP